jgi:hypothetical protein
LELATDSLNAGSTCAGCLMARPTFAWTARFVAEQLGVEEDLVEEIASMAMEPEDGRISIIDSNDGNSPSVTAFTRDGIGYLRETLRDPSSCYYRPSPRP